MKTLWRCDNCDIVSSCSDIILSCSVIRSEWRRFSASTIFPSEATIASCFNTMVEELNSRLKCASYEHNDITYATCASLCCLYMT
ncbi:hypothetical protein FKM82_022940 [Ascaphus truei]